MTKVSEIGTGATRVLGVRRNQESGALPYEGCLQGSFGAPCVAGDETTTRREPAEPGDIGHVWGARWGATAIYLGGFRRTWMDFLDQDIARQRTYRDHRGRLLASRGT